MTIPKVGINGFGRIGRMVLRAATLKSREKCGIGEVPQIVAINDPSLQADHAACLLKHDSTHGIFPGEIEVMGSAIKVDGRLIDVFNVKEPEKIPWNKSCVKYVVECTGIYTTYEHAALHLHDGVERVLISAPSNDAPMFVLGVNHECYSNDMKVVSMASCTTNCLAPLAKVLHENFDIEQGLMTTVHAVTASQNVLDSPKKKDWRLGRGAYQNIIPSTTGAAKSIGKIIPDLDGRLNGISVRVPVPTGSLLDLTFKFGKTADYETIKCKVKEASEGPLKGILGYTQEKIVSSDIIGDQRSSIFDATGGMALSKCFVKVLAWYDNEWAYACRLVDMLKYMASRESTCKENA